MGTHPGGPGSDAEAVVPRIGSAGRIQKQKIKEECGARLYYVVKRMREDVRRLCHSAKHHPPAAHSDAPISWSFTGPDGTSVVEHTTVKGAYFHLSRVCVCVPVGA